MKDHLTSRECAEVARLRELSACLGRNPLLVQASTGNTSVKVEGTLWMKASGKWFAHADQDDFFVDLDVSEIQECLRDKNIAAIEAVLEAGSRLHRNDNACDIAFPGGRACSFS